MIFFKERKPSPRSCIIIAKVYLREFVQFVNVYVCFITDTYAKDLLAGDWIRSEYCTCLIFVISCFFHFIIIQ